MARGWDVVSEDPIKGGDGWEPVRTDDIVKPDAEGGGFGTRAMASVRQTVDGKVSLLKKVYGEKNVRVRDVESSNWVRQPDTGKPGTVSSEQIEIRPDGAKDFVPFDEQGLSLKDFTADLIGPAIEVFPALLGSGTVAGAAAGAGAGQAARQMISDVLPGQEGMSTKERVGSIAASAATAGAVQGVVNSGAWVVDAVRNIPTKFAQRAAATRAAQEGAKLSVDTGVPLTFAQETGSRGALMVENTAAQMVSAADDFAQFHQKQLHAAVQNLGKQMNAQSTDSGALVVGSRIKQAFDHAMERATGLRQLQAKSDFDEVARLAGDRPVVKATNLTTTIDNLIKDFDVPGAGDAAQGIVRSMKALRNSLLKEAAPPANGDQARFTLLLPGSFRNPVSSAAAPEAAAPPSAVNLTAQQTNRLLQVYTNAQRGTGVLLKDMDKAQSRLLSGRLKDALLLDLDSAASTGSDDVVKALQTARDNYRANSKVIGELGDSVLSRLIGDGTRAPETIAERFLKMKPSEIKSAVDILEQSTPQAAEAVRRRFIEDAVERAVPATTQQTANGLRFSAARFLSNLPDQERLVAAGFKPNELRELQSLSRVLERVADRALSGSQTAPMQLTWDTIKGLFTLNLPEVAKNTATLILVPKKIAKAALTPGGRQALLTVSNTSQTLKARTAAAAYLAQVAGTEE